MKTVRPSKKVGGSWRSALLVGVFLLALLYALPSAKSAPLSVVDLSGTWTFTPQGSSANTIQVPGGGWYKQGFTTVAEADYQRTIVVPNSGGAQLTKIEFGAVNHQAVLYVNETPVGTNTTSFTPSSFDITSFVTPGQSYTIRVHVKGRKALVVNGQSIVPTAAGWSTNLAQGIFRSAQLVIYPQVAIADVFVRPSVGNATLSYVVSVTNGSSSSQNLTLSGNLTSWNGDAWSYPAISDQAISVAPHSVNTVVVGPIPWTAGTNSYWWPNVPYQAGYQARLHLLNVILRNGATNLDTQTTRFGFRELVQRSDGANTCYFLNGVRVNFRGDSLQGADYDSIFQGGGYGDAFGTLSGFLAGTNGWTVAVDNYQRLNFNFVRLHQEPVTPYMLDVCDEQGLMVMEETAIRGSNQDQDFVLGHDNMVNHLKALFTRDRNHPSIVRQSLSNEPNFAYNDSVQFETDLYNAAMAVDGTRPLSIDAYGYFYDAMAYTNFSVYNHYGNGVGAYTEIVWARTDRPYGQGEFVWNVDNTYQGFTWFATATEAMRRQGASDIRPYTLLSAWASFVPGVKTTDMILEQGGHPLYGADNLTNAWGNPQIQRVQAGFNPVLVADLDYWNANKLSDSSGDWPANVPSLPPNQPITRKLSVYNDTFSGTTVNVFWELRQGSATGPLVNSGQINPTVPLGYISTQNISFTIPSSLDGTLYYLVLYTQKGGVEMFRETEEKFAVINELQLAGTLFGTSPAFSAGSEYDKASDGNLSTYFDNASPDGGYTGIDLGVGNTASISSIVFSPRNGLEWRMEGGVFQGSNDGANYTTLYQIPAIPSQNTRVAINCPLAFRYLRYLGPGNSYCNIADMAFYVSKAGLRQLSGTPFGTSPASAAGKEYDKASDGNVNTFFDYANPNGGYTGIDLGAGNATALLSIAFSPRNGFEARMVGGVFQGSNDGTNYTSLYAVTNAPSSNSFAPISSAIAYRYFRYLGPTNSYCNIAEMTFYASGLRQKKGAAFGTSPASAGGNEYDRASDGDLATFFDYASPNGGYTGVDVGAGNAAPITHIAFSPRSGFETRMVGGVFQGSNDGTNYTPLYIQTSAPSLNTSAAISTPVAYRYLRYAGPSNSYCNIAEMAFYTAPLFKLSGAPFGTSPAFSPGTEYDKSSDGNTNTYFDNGSADGGYAGIDLGAGNQAQVRYIRVYPRSGFAARLMGGIFQGASDGTNYTTICTISGTPLAGATYVANAPSAYRFFRYVGPPGSYCNIAEMEFYGVTAQSTFLNPIVETNTNPSGATQLSASRENNTIQLTWPVTGANLYYAPNLTSPVTWTLVNQTPSVTNGQASLSLPIGSNQTGFFQLR